MLIARRMTYAGSSLPGVDLRDETGKLIASCFAHGPEGEAVLRSLLETFPGDDVIVSYIRPQRITRETIRSEAASLAGREAVQELMLSPVPAPDPARSLKDRLAGLGKVLIGALAT